MSYQPPRILLAGIHLGCMMGKTPGKTLSQSDWPDTTQKLTLLLLLLLLSRFSRV